MHTFNLLALSVLSLTGSSLACGVVSGVKFTAYGYPDADGTPAYKCNGNKVVPTQAGDKTMLGDGSFGKPYAAAAASGSVFTKCELLYHPLLKKYFRVQDNCSGCGKLQESWVFFDLEDYADTPLQSQNRRICILPSTTKMSAKAAAN